MKKIVQKHWLTYGWTILLSAASAVLFSLFSIQLGAVIDVVVHQEADFAQKIGRCGLMALLAYFVSMFYVYAKSKNISGIIQDVKKEVVRALNRKEISDYQRKSNEYYLNNLTKNIDILKENYLSPRCEIIAEILTAIVTLCFLFSIHWKLCLYFIGISLLVMALSQLPGKLMAKKTHEFSEKNAEYLKMANNYLHGFEQMKLLGLSALFFHRYQDQDRRFEQSRFSYMFVTEAASYLGMFFSFFAQLACMSVGVWFALKGEITVGLLIAAVNLLNSVFNPIRMVAQYKNLMGTTDEIRQDLDVILAEPEKQGGKLVGPIRTIDLKDLSLQFGDEKVLFDHYDLHFSGHQKYAIVGESGRGKSTLMKLVMKYYQRDAYQGQVLVNGQAVETLASDALYQRIAYIQRNDFYLAGTVEENIALGRDLPDEQALYQKLKFTEAFLQKPIEAGSRNQVSTGEKQRIDMARFLVKDYEVLIFDEPTSNLDPETSRIVFDLILGIENKMVIVITHVNEVTILDRFDEVIRL